MQGYTYQEEVSKPTFSLIMPTLGRGAEVELFLRSLAAQRRRDFELIVVDQNADSLVERTCAPFQEHMTIRLIKSAVKGLSVNRNTGLAAARGTIIAFPDDDCEYEPNTLLKAAEYLGVTPPPPTQ